MTKVRIAVAALAVLLSLGASGVSSAALLPVILRPDITAGVENIVAAMSEGVADKETIGNRINDLIATIDDHLDADAANRDELLAARKQLVSMKAKLADTHLTSLCEPAVESPGELAISGAQTSIQPSFTPPTSGAVAGGGGGGGVGGGGNSLLSAASVGVGGTAAISESNNGAGPNKYPLP